MILCLAGQIHAQSLKLRVSRSWVEDGRLYWEVQANQESAANTSAAARQCGPADFYFLTNQAAFSSASPQISWTNPEIAVSGNYSWRTGRSPGGHLCWIALDCQTSSASQAFTFIQNGWSSLYIANLPIASADAKAEFSWHETATGCLDGNQYPLSLDLEDIPDPTLNDSTLSFTDVSSEAFGSTGKGGHGLLVCDITEDGWPDLYITKYYEFPGETYSWGLCMINQSGSYFKQEEAARTIKGLDGGTHGAAFGDLDNDGDYDFVNGTTWKSLSDHTGQNIRIYENTGQGNFTERTSDSPDVVSSKQETRGVALLDLDNDGDLDIFTVSGYLGTNDPSTEKNEVYLNQGNWQFVKDASSILPDVKIGQGVVDTDFDGDGDMDLICANRTGGLAILQNDGAGHFTQLSPQTLGINHQAGDGVSMGDIDRDGDQDLLLVTADPPRAIIYRNDGSAYTLQTELAIKQGYMGGFADLDNDGDLDVMFSHYGPCFLNDGEGNFGAGPVPRFPSIANPTKTPPFTDPRAIAFADYDNDGDLDFAIAAKNTQSVMIRNNLDAQNNWLKIKLTAPDGQAGAFGSKVKIYSPGGIELLGFLEAHSTHGYLAQDDPVLHFGLGSYAYVDVVVDFPDGQRATRTFVSANQIFDNLNPNVQVPVRIFLEGPYRTSTGKMAATLNSLGLLPNLSPYSEDSRYAITLPSNAVDWVLVELRTSPTSSALARKAALVSDEGWLMDWDRPGMPMTINVLPGDYYVVIKHRNHLPVMTASPLSLKRIDGTAYDLTASSDHYYETSKVIEVNSNVFGLIAGNTDSQDEAIYASDLALIQIDRSKTGPGYFTGDLNFDGQASESDYQLAAQHMLMGLYSRIP